MVQGKKAGVRRMKHSAKSLLSRFLRDEAGATAIEYALIASATSLAIVAAMPAIGQALGVKFSDIAAGLD